MNQCRQCKRALPADAKNGICPSCVLGLARGIDPFGAETRALNPDQESFPTPEELNRLLPSYRVEKLIGQGGMGAVYQAHQPSLDRTLAIKIMSRRFANDPSFAERFAREARTMARLNHQNIVNVYDYGQAENACYLVMEYVDGVNLRQAMRDGKLTAEQSLVIIPQVCEALQFAHDEGIIHRDIKPENILIDKKGRVKIADFGLAKLIDDDKPSFTLTGSRQILGTLNYMAPEQIERPMTVDHRADIYSLGVVLYELLTGELPLGRFQLPGEKFAGHAALDDVVVRTLERQPDRRFQQASEVRSAVEIARASASFQNMAPASTSPAGIRLENRPVPPIKSPENLSPDVPRVKFEIENPWHGMTVTKGILSVQPDGVAINYSKRENVFNSTMLGGSGKHLIPYSEILKAELKAAWFSYSLILKLDTVDDYVALFAEEPGTLIFTIKTSDEEEVRSVINAIRARKGHQQLSFVSLKPEEQRNQAQRRMLWPAIGLLIAGMINTAVFPIAIGRQYLFKQASSNERADFDKEKSEKMVDVKERELEIRSLEKDLQIKEDKLKVVAKRKEELEAANEISNPSHEVSPAPTSVSIKAETGSVPNGLDITPNLLPPAVPATPPSVAKVPLPTIISTVERNTPQEQFFGYLHPVGWTFIGLIICSGGLAMLLLKSWGWCLATSILALIPIHPGAIIGIPAGICALLQLSRECNRSHFE